MPRPPRLLLSRSFYHIMARGNNRHQIFKEEKDYFYYLELMGKYKKELPFDLYHYCLMPTHIHFLTQTKEPADFSDFMKRLSLAYFSYFQKRYGWVGHLWQGRFKSQPVGKDEYFIQCGKYIELNPVRAGIVKSPEEYLFSSYSYYSKGAPDKLITGDFLYESLGDNLLERQKSYRNLLFDEIVEKSYRRSVCVRGRFSNRYTIRIF